jgi:hypothetical protein
MLLRQRCAEISRENKIVRETRFYMICNARLDQEWSDADRRTLSILPDLFRGSARPSVSNVITVFAMAG